MDRFVTRRQILSDCARPAPDGSEQKVGNDTSCYRYEGRGHRDHCCGSHKGEERQDQPYEAGKHLNRIGAAVDIGRQETLGLAFLQSRQPPPTGAEKAADRLHAEPVHQCAGQVLHADGAPIFRDRAHGDQRDEQREKCGKAELVGERNARTVHCAGVERGQQRDEQCEADAFRRRS